MFSVTLFFLKIIIFDLQTVFFYGKVVFFKLLAESTSKSKFSTHFVQIPYHLHPARQGAHPALSNSLGGATKGLIRISCFRFSAVVMSFADCYLRQGAHPAWQGASGTEFARSGSITCFLRWFYKRSQTYFGQKPEEHGLSIKKRCLELKNKDFWENLVMEKNVIQNWLVDEKVLSGGPKWWFLRNMDDGKISDP